MPKETAVSSSDLDALRETHQLVRSNDYDEQHCDDWRVRMARRFYNQLYKEYAIIDLSRYKEGKYGLRWRTEAEVISSKGQQICASKHCDSSVNLATFELPFKYSEGGAIKRELIKVCLCEHCSDKLRYRGGGTEVGSKTKRKGEETGPVLKKHKG
jgi:protein FRA10AC1